MVQHYFACAWLLPRRRSASFARKVDTNLYSVGMIVPLGDRARRQQGRRRRVRRPAGREQAAPRWRPGLELVKDYGWFTILAKPLFWLLDQLHDAAGQLGLVDRGAGGAAEDRLLLAQRQGLPLAWPR